MKRILLLFLILMLLPALSWGFRKPMYVPGSSLGDVAIFQNGQWLPLAQDDGKYLKSGGTWDTPAGGDAITVTSPLQRVVDDIKLNYADGLSLAGINLVVTNPFDPANVAIIGGTISGVDVTVGVGKTLDVSAGTLTLADRQISIGKIANPTTVFYVAPVGGDYTTIQAALDDNVTTDIVFWVYPGTYTDDTINFTANNQSIRGVGLNGNQTITTANSTIVNYGAFTGCEIRHITLSVTNPTTDLSMITGTGDLHLTRSVLNVTTSNINASEARILSGSGDVTYTDIILNYTNTAIDAAAYKAPIFLDNGSTHIFDRCVFNVIGSGASTAHVLVYGTGTGIVDAFRSIITLTDLDTSIAAGFGYIAGSGEHEFNYNEVHITAGGGNTALGGYYLSDTSLTIKSTHNHIHVLGGTARLATVGANATLISSLDTVVAADEVTGAGTYIETIARNDTGDFDVSGNLDAGTITEDGVGVYNQTQSDAAYFPKITITGTANEIDVADGDGSGNPTISLPDAITLSGKTITGGTYAGVEGLTMARSENPGWEAGVSTCDDDDINASTVVTATDTDSGEEDIDVEYKHQEAGALVTYMKADADGNLELGRTGMPIEIKDTLIMPDVTTGKKLVADGTGYEEVYGVMTETLPIGWADNTDATNPAALETYTTSGNSRPYKVRKFAGTVADENITVNWVVPDDFYGTTIKVRWRGIVTEATGPSNEVISFQASAISIADGEDGDFAAFGDVVSITKTAITAAQDILLKSAFVEVTPTGIAAGETVVLLFNRDMDDVDTYEQDFGIMFFDVRYQTIELVTY